MNKDGDTVIHYASYKEPGQSSKCLEALINSPGVDLNCKNRAGRTPLMCAAHHGKASAVKVLLRSGAKAAPQSSDGETAIHVMAALQGKTACLKAALECGVDPDLKNQASETLLHVAARGGVADSVELLIENKATVNKMVEGGAMEGLYPLHIAAAAGYMDVCQALVKKGSADITLKSRAGRLAREMAAQAGHSAVAEMLGAATREEDILAGKVLVATGGGAYVEGDPEGLVPCNDVTRQKVQTLMDVTWKNVTTRDRNYSDLQEFEVVQVLQNSRKACWDKYRERQDQITNHYVEKLQDVKTVVDGWEESLQLARDPMVNEFFLFHGTNPSAAQSICETGFNVDLSGMNKGALYGPGVYLAESSAKADEYAGDDKDGLYKGLYAMLLCRASLGNPIINEEVQPDKEEIRRLLQAEDKHSVVGDREKVRGTFREFIVCDGRGVYPAYVIIYRRKQKS